MPIQAVRVLYTNHRGETRWRTILPLELWFGECLWHPGQQWLLLARDLDRETMDGRTFALKDIKEWQPLPSLS